MKLAGLGWEADRIYKSTVQCITRSPSRPIVIVGYQFNLAMTPSDPPFIGSYRSSQVLWQCRIDGIQMTDDWGKATLTDMTGKQNLHGGGAGVPNVLASAILKASPWTSAVNLPLTMSGLSIAVPANASVVMFASHAGEGPVDFECQGVIYYEVPQ